MKYRELTPDEISAAYQMAERIYTGYSTADLTGDAQEGHVFFIGCFAGSKMVGCAKGDERGTLHFVIVEDGYRMRGIGRELVKRICEVCCNKCCILRITARTVPGTEGFFVKCGFQDAPALSDSQDGQTGVREMERIISPGEIRPRRMSKGMLAAVIGGGALLLLLLLIVIGVIVVLNLSGLSVKYGENSGTGTEETGMDPQAQDVPADGTEDDIRFQSDTPSSGSDNVTVKPDDPSMYDPEPGYVSLPVELINEPAGESESYEESYEKQTARALALIWAYISDEVDYKIEESAYTEYESTDRSEIDFDVRYPQIYGLPSGKEEEINQTLRDTAMFRTEMYYLEPNTQIRGFLAAEEYLILGSNVDYKVTYLDENLLSVVFVDHYFVGSTLSEYSEIRPVTVDLNTGEVYRIEDNLAVDEDFIPVWRERILQKKPENMSALNLSDDVFMKMLDGERVDGRYKSELILKKDGAELAFSYAFLDESSIERGWVTVDLTDEELAEYTTDTKMWHQYWEEQQKG